MIKLKDHNKHYEYLYHYIDFSSKRTQDILNELGDKGWILTADKDFTGRRCFYREIPKKKIIIK